MDQSNGTASDSSDDVFCSDENVHVTKEILCENKSKDIDYSLNDILSEKSQTVAVENQNDCNTKSFLKHSNSNLNNDAFKIQEGNEIHATMDKLLETLTKNIDDTNPLMTDSSIIDQSSKSEVDDTEVIDIQIIENANFIRGEKKDISSAITILSDDNPSDKIEKDDSSEEIEILEEIIKTEHKTFISSSNEESISLHSNSSLLKSDNSKISNDDKSVELNEPTDMSLSQTKEISENRLKSLLEQKTEILESESSTSCSKQENDSSQSSNTAQKEESIEKVIKEETGFPDCLKDLVTIGNYAPVMGDFTLKGNEALIDCPSIVTPFLVKQPDKFPISESKISAINPNFFDTSIGDFLIQIGFNRVSEWYHRDMAKIKSHRIKSSGKTEELVQELKNHQTHYLQAKKENEHFVFPPKTCTICNYATESSLVLEGHMLIPHFTAKRELQCNYCSYFHRDSKTMLEHMKAVHNKVGFVDHIYSGYECPCCIFETNSRPKLHTHINKCLKYFNHSKNQAPIRDFEFPCLTPKPITVNIVKSYEKSISGHTRGRPMKPIEHSQNYYQPQIYPSGNQTPNFKSFPIKNVLSDDLLNQMYSNVNSCNSAMPTTQHNSNNYFHHANQIASNTVQSPRPFLPHRNRAIKTMNASTFENSSFCRSEEYNKPTTNVSSSVPHLPRLQGPLSAPTVQDKLPSNISSSPHSLVVCEICDGYIKDLEQLRMHMQLIHKVKINPKMLSSRPPLNCQKCFWRFFTDHGLERHLLGSHGLVTSNMQELAEKNKDAGCCTLCGKVYASKLVAHMNQLHKIALKPANLSYKCTVCSATFGLYRLFESHVYLVHAGGTKRPSSENVEVPRKSLKLNGPC